MKKFSALVLSICVFAILSSCGSGSEILTTPIENIDNTPIKEQELTEREEQTWGHLDLVKDTIPGMSVDKAYSELLRGKQGRTVIVAVIDSGIDIDHEDLDSVIWKNSGEIAGNGKDDDNNGYIDDVHGYNFLGDAYNEQLEYVRILAKGDTSHPEYSKAQTELQQEYSQALQIKQNVEAILQQVPPAQEILRKHLKKDDYTKDEVLAINDPNNQALMQAKNIQMFMYDNNLNLKDVEEALEHYSDQINYNLNKDFDGRQVVGDNPDDIEDRDYGNGNVKPVKKTESHGTHVAGIIAAERNNGKGVNGVAQNVKIMSLRAVPNGDEYDKDIALAIRYAVDNGARIINGSFGKSYSTHSDWVHDAIKYAEKRDVLFVHAAGNDSKNIDLSPEYPNDNNNGVEIVANYISVGALDPKYGSNLVSSFSNYGKNNVDVFAPGGKVYSTMPENEYKAQGGTSMAAPAVAGVAALIRSYYPNLKASQVKQIIMDSGLALKPKVVVGGDPSNVKPFSDLSKSGKLVNAYNALVMAAQVAK